MKNSVKFGIKIIQIFQMETKQYIVLLLNFRINQTVKDVHM